MNSIQQVGQEKRSLPGIASPFERRGLDPEVAARCGAGFQGGNFVFAYRSSGVSLYRKVRTPDKKFFIQPSGAPKSFWNIESIQDMRRPPSALVITEGEFDTITAVQCDGFPAVSVPNGSNASPTEPGKLVADDLAFSYLWGADERLIPEIAQFKRVILAVDDDPAGRVLLQELSIRIGRSRCWTVTYPKGCKDLNEVLLDYGAEAVRHVLRTAQPLQPGKLVKPSQAKKEEFVQTYSTGMPFLDKHIMLTRPELVVVTGIPGHGKGVLTRSICYHLAESYGLRTAFWAPEDKPSRIVRDMKRFAMRKNMHPSLAEQKRAEEWADAHFMISELFDTEPPTVPRLVDEMEAAVFHHNCQAFVLDPWNCLIHARGNLSETEYIERTLEEFKSKMRQLNLMLFMVAHPTKIKNGEHVTAYSINGSANWFNKADHVIIASRGNNPDGNVSDNCVVSIEKSKDNETMGVPGKVHTKYDRLRADYTELPMAA